MRDIGQVSYETIDGLKIRIARSGAEIGMPIVLLSPWPESILGFRDIVPNLRHLGPIYAIDLPGFGRSEGADRFMSPRGMADFLHIAFQHLGLDRLHAVGPDIGTLALLFAAATYPEQFKSLTLGSGGTSLPLAGPGLGDLINSPKGTFQAMEGGDLALSFIRQSSASDIPPEVLEDYRLSSTGTRFEQATDFVRAYLADLPALEPLLPTITVPSLVISSDRDAMVPPANGEFLCARLPRCSHQVLEGGHLIWEDASQEYSDLLLDWLTNENQSA